MRAAARFVAEHDGHFPDGAAPASATQRAVLAVELVDAFVGRDVDPDPEAVREILASRRSR